MVLASQPKPRGVLSPDFLKPKRADDDSSADDGNLKLDEPFSNVTNVPQKKAPAKASVPKAKKDISKLSWKDTSIDDLFSSDEEDEYDDLLSSSASKLSNMKISEPITWDQIPANENGRDTKSVRRRQYREGCERLKRWFEAVDALDLPPNPLDRYVQPDQRCSKSRILTTFVFCRLLNELGGPEKVAGKNNTSRGRMIGIDVAHDFVPSKN